MKYNINLYGVSSGRRIKEDGTVVNEADGINADGSKNIQSKYLDLGEVINVTNMAAGVNFYCPWFDNLTWVRNCIVMVSSDQQYDLILQRRDTSGIADWAAIPAPKATATGYHYSLHVLNETNKLGLLGYSARFALRNTAETALASGKVRVQLMGI